MKRILLVSVATGSLFLLFSLSSISAHAPMQVAITPTAFNYLPLIVKNYPPTPTSPPPPGTALFETVLWVANPSGYATTPDNSSLDLGRADGEDFTIETFFYVSNTTDNDPVIDLLTRKDMSYQVNIKFNSTNPDWVSFKIWAADGSSVTLSYLTHLMVGWHHVAAVFDNEFTANEDLLAIYLDGSRVARSADENIHVDWTPGIPNSTSPLLVGGVPFGTAGFSGFIDEMRFSSIVRYSDTSYTVPTAAFTADSNTRALWHFNEVSGSTIFADSSGNGNTLTGQNGAQTHNP